MRINEQIAENTRLMQARIAELQKRNKEQIRLSARKARKLVKVLTSKPFVCVLLLVVQLAVLIAGFFLLDKFIDINVFLLVAGVISFFFAIHIINSKRPNEYKLMWIIFVLTLTILGMIAYLIFRKKKIGKRRMRKIRQKISGLSEYYAENKTVLQAARSEDAFLYQTANYITANGKLPLSTADDMLYFDIGEKYFERLKAELNRAEKFIFLEYFIISEGQLWREIFEILKERAQNGVDVRIIYDDLGCLTGLPKSFGKDCVNAGIKLYCFNRLRPVWDVAQNNRTHRKIAVIDGVCAFTGGVNIADEYVNLIEKHGRWKDTGIMLKGKAVKNFTLMFLLNWAVKYGEEDISAYIPEYQSGETDNADKTFCLPFCDMPGTDKAICEQVYLKLIYNAKDYVYINTPYFIVGDKMKEALIAAAESGVDIRITVPHIPDQKVVFGLTQAFYTPLVLSGVKVYQYKPGFIHAKSIVVDDTYAVIGTSNMDFRSFYLHHECDVLIYKAVCAQMRLDYENTCGQSILITPEYAKNIPVRTRIWRAFLRIFAPLM
jgi:cardiolipin synthase